MPGWVTMWILAFAVMAAGKLALLRLHGNVHAAWLWGWPGMDPERFHRRPSHEPCAREANGAWVRMALGASLLWGVVPRLDGLLAAWIGLVALGLLLHFGFVHLLSIVWRLHGFDAQPLFDRTLSSRSIGEFWGRRWNRAFADLAGRTVYRPLAPRVGPRAALFSVFVVSGLVHELLLSVPAGAGYGLCTLYFVIQAIGVLVERRRRSRALTALFVVVPLPLLFHLAFMQNVLLPFLEVLS
jgi:hypothetical protein